MNDPLWETYVQISIQIDCNLFRTLFSKLKNIYNVVRCSGLVQIDHESQLCLSLLSTHLNQIQGQVIFQVLQPAKGCYACCWLVKIIFFSVKCFSCNFLRCGFFFHLWWKKMEQFVLTLKK